MPYHALILGKFNSGKTLRAIVWSALSNQAFNNSGAQANTTEVWDDASVADYAITVAELGTSGIYAFVTPAAVNFPYGWAVFEAPGGTVDLYLPVGGGNGEIPNTLQPGVPVVDLRFVNGLGPVGTVSNLSGTFTVSSPVDPDDDNRLTLVQGDDYTTGNHLPSWTLEGYTGPSLADATCRLLLLPIHDYTRKAADAVAVLNTAATVTQDDTTLTVTAALTSAQTAALATTPPLDETTHEYQLVATTSGTNLTITLALGPVTVRRRVKQA